MGTGGNVKSILKSAQSNKHNQSVMFADEGNIFNNNLLVDNHQRSVDETTSYLETNDDLLDPNIKPISMPYASLYQNSIN